VREAPSRLTERGRLLLGFCSIGNAERLARECAEAGLRIELMWSQSHEVEGDTTLEFQILELCRR
jgi:hypothetical protein